MGAISLHVPIDHQCSVNCNANNKCVCSGALNGAEQLPLGREEQGWEGGEELPLGDDERWEEKEEEAEEAAEGCPWGGRDDGVGQPDNKGKRAEPLMGDMCSLSLRRHLIF